MRAPLVSVAIQTHRDRAEMALALRRCLGGQAELVFDPDPDGYPAAWRSYRAALELTPSWATHRLILQDDVLVCDHFLRGVQQAVAAQPEAVICLFVSGQLIHRVGVLQRALADGHPWVVLDQRTWLPAVATLWPRHHADELPAWYDRQDYPTDFLADDEIIGRYLNALGESALATVPSLVEHPDTVPSLVDAQNRRHRDGRNLERRAVNWIGDLDCGCDATQIDWSGPTAPLF